MQSNGCSSIQNSVGTLVLCALATANTVFNYFGVASLLQGAYSSG